MQVLYKFLRTCIYLPLSAEVSGALSVPSRMFGYLKTVSLQFVLLVKIIYKV